MSRKISMRKLRELIRLKFDCRLSHRQIGKSLNMSPSTVSYYSRAVITTQLDRWPLPEDWDDKKLKEVLEPHCKQLQQQIQSKVKPDWSHWHQELNHKGVTLQLLWQEYRKANANRCYSYGYICRHYRRWKQKQYPSMRQNHKPGRCFYVDYAGVNMHLTHPDTGEKIPVKLFVGGMGVSQKIYAEAVRSRSLPDWVGAHIRAFDYLGAIPEIVVPDNEKAAVHKASMYDPDVNPTYHDMLKHYNSCAIPARPRKPKDKPKAENAVLQVERWVIAPLRRQTFFTLEDLNQAIREKVNELNHRPYQQQPGSRDSQYVCIDKPHMKPLPQTPYRYATFSQSTVALDYHVKVDGHCYSVPHRYLKERVDIRLTDDVVEIFYQHKRIAMHARSFKQGSATTVQDHMPKSHQQHACWTPEAFIQWATQSGEHTLAMANGMLNRSKHPEQSYRMHLGLKRLAKLYGHERLNRACQKANRVGIYRFEQLHSMLKHRLESIPDITDDDTSTSVHANIRGHQYFH